MKKPIKKYAGFVSNNPKMVLVICLAISILMVLGTQMIETKKNDYQDMLPEDYDVIKAYETISEEFGGAQAGKIVIQIDNSYANSNELKSVLEPEALRYSLKIENYLSKLDYVEEVSGFGQIVEKNKGSIPNDISLLRKISDSYGKGHISKDESMALIKISFDEEIDSKIATNEISELINKINSPEGFKVGLSGSVFEDVIVQEQLGPDMQRTSTFSIIAIITILFLLFRSFKGIAMPLTTIIFGVLWAMGFLGLMSMGLSSMTSGTISMIMGIGIDFGIQIMNRYNQELKKQEKKAAMEKTLEGVLKPIITTALACLIGFQAMSLGELSMMSELGNIMSLGVVFCMLAAISIVPCLLIIFSKDRFNSKKNS